MTISHFMRVHIAMLFLYARATQAISKLVQDISMECIEMVKYKDIYEGLNLSKPATYICIP